MRRQPHSDAAAAPRPALGVLDAVALIVGIVIGAGIFVTPALVATNTSGPALLIAAWTLGGLIALVGALCYAELATTYPHAGGDYHYLARAFGQDLAFLFGWARMTVIPTGSIALLAFVFGDYATQLADLGEHSSALYAALVVLILTGLNIAGVDHGRRTQNVLTVLEVAGLALVIAAGLVFAAPPAESFVPTATESAPDAAFGLAMVFVLLSYGGWNEASYISAEVRGRRRNVALALLVSIALIAVLYLLVNLAYLKGLGFEQMSRSDAVAADLLRAAFGAPGAALISILVAVAALTSANATILLGARTTYAIGKDFPQFARLGQWSARANSPVPALLLQGAITLLLVALGAYTRKGVETMIGYTAPVFWFFFTLTGAAMIVLRRRGPAALRPYRVPLYPLTPILFCASSAYLLYASIAHTGIGALFGVAVLGIGAVVLVASRVVPGRRVPYPSKRGAKRAPRTSS